MSAPDVFAAWHLDQGIRQASSSGGIFSAFAELILAKGGMVVGAAFDEQLVVRHIIVESLEGLQRLRGAKYIQSVVSAALYRQIRDAVKQGRMVLFSGTPCQVAGLRHFLRHPCEILYCCDLICMGVPSPLLFIKYINWKSSQTGSRIESFEFRNKSIGWKSPSVTLRYENGEFESSRQNPYQLAFLKRIALRSSCYACLFKGIRRQGDLTLGDFWGVAKKYPEFDLDDRGTSLMLVNTEKGQRWLDACRSRLFVGSTELDTAIAGNPMLVRSCQRPPERECFYQDIEALPYALLIRKYGLCPPTFLQRVRRGLKRRVTNSVRSIMRPNAGQD